MIMPLSMMMSITRRVSLSKSNLVTRKLSLWFLHTLLLHQRKLWKK